MTNQQIILVKKTWWLIRNYNPIVIGDSFYSKLFSEKPSLRRIFTGETDEQYKTLVAMLNLIIAKLDKPDHLADELEALVRRQKDFKVTSSYYKPIEEALLWTVEKALGKECTIEILAAWKSCYASLTEKMIAASEQDAK